MLKPVIVIAPKCDLYQLSGSDEVWLEWCQLAMPDGVVGYFVIDDHKVRIASIMCHDSSGVAWTTSMCRMGIHVLILCASKRCTCLCWK